MSELTLRIITPHGNTEDILCDSVHLWVSPDSNGKGEGYLGIRKGHIKSIIALADGNLIAYLKDNQVFSCNVHGGFATVEDDLVSVLTDASIDNIKYNT